jgi:hypothetical protein
MKTKIMKTIKNFSSRVKWILFVAVISFGVAVGIMMNNLRSGIALGIATGLTGIIGALYYQDRLSKHNEKLKNSAVPVADQRMKKVVGNDQKS